MSKIRSDYGTCFASTTDAIFYFAEHNGDSRYNAGRAPVAATQAEWLRNIMSRRVFIRKLLAGLKVVLLASLVPAPLRAAKAAGEAPAGLHYRPLEGRSMREWARRKTHHGPDQFLNPLGIGRGGRMRQVLSWKLFHKNRFKEDLDKQPIRRVGVDWDAVSEHKGVSVTFLKHASVMIRDNGRSLLVDPVFSGMFWFIKDFTPLETVGMPPPDEVLITHGHYDHLDIDTLAALSPATRLITPLGYGDVFAGLRMPNRTQLDWYEKMRVGGAEITLLPCNHWTMRNPLIGPNRSLWGSYLIRTAGGKTIYLSGDTAYFDGFEQLGSDYDIDLAIFNLGAYEPRWFMAPSHINPAETACAFRELNARRLMIAHWGTFRLGDEPVHFPPLDIRAEMHRAGMADRLVSIKHGQTVFF